MRHSIDSDVSSARLDILVCSTLEQIHKSIAQTLETYQDILPADPNASILIKPNLNSNMNALTGNTTDLRVLSGIIKFLKDASYTNITIGEGTNSGFYRNDISVISRLKIDELAKHYGVGCIDLNRSTPVGINFENHVMAGVASECLNSDFLINVPKLKTHFEAGMSVCLKNLIGCLVGQENKKKTHLSLAENIVNLTEAIKPDLHIVDAVFAMEGLGPTRGMPLKTDTVFIGTDPYLIDLLAARFARFDIDRITPLLAARRRGLVTKREMQTVEQMPIKPFPRPFEPPDAGPIATFIHSPKRQKYFLAVRNTPFFNFLCNTDIAGRLLFATGLRQDVFIPDEMDITDLSISKNDCTECRKCMDYCPVGINLPESLEKGKPKGCISCLYCYLVCPERAIKIKGVLGFMEEQLRQYDDWVRKIS